MDIRQMESTHLAWMGHPLLLTRYKADLTTVPLSDSPFHNPVSPQAPQTQANILFYCGEGKHVTIGSILLEANLPMFVDRLRQFQNCFQISSNDTQFIPIVPLYLEGVDVDLLNAFLNFCMDKDGQAMILSWDQTLVIKKVVELLNIEDIIINVQPVVQCWIAPPSMVVGAEDTEKKMVDPESSIEPMMNDEEHDIQDKRVKKLAKKRSKESKKREDSKLVSRRYPKAIKAAALAELNAGEETKAVARKFNLKWKTVSEWKYKERKKMEKQQLANDAANGTTGVVSTTEDYQLVSDSSLTQPTASTAEANNESSSFKSSEDASLWLENLYKNNPNLFGD